MMRTRPVLDVSEAVRPIVSGASVMVGGFGLVGTPLHLLDALCEAGVTDLTIISNNVGEPGKGLGRLLRERRIRKVIGSYFTSNREVADAYARGELEVEIVPQGNLAESIRSGGIGVPAFYSPVGVGTELTVGQETRELDGVEYALVRALRADFALIHAYEGDCYGNLRYVKTAENFNPVMAMAAGWVIASVERLAESALKPEDVETQGVFVDSLVHLGDQNIE